MASNRKEFWMRLFLRDLVLQTAISGFAYIFGLAVVMFMESAAEHWPAAEALATGLRWSGFAHFFATLTHFTFAIFMPVWICASIFTLSRLIWRLFGWKIIYRYALYLALFIFGFLQILAEGDSRHSELNRELFLLILTFWTIVFLTVIASDILFKNKVYQN